MSPVTRSRSGVGAAEITDDSIVDADINSAAAISYSKLATLATGKILAGNANTPTATTLGGDATIGATGTLTVANDSITLAKLAAASKADWEYAYSGYKVVVPTRYSAGLNAIVAASGVYAFNYTTVTLPATDTSPGSTFYLDPAKFAAGSRTVKYNLAASVSTNATTPDCNFTFGLYPVSAYAGGASVQSFTAGTVTAGSTVTLTTPGASAITQDVSGDFTAPAAGAYFLGVTLTANTANNSRSTGRVSLLMRQV